MMETTRSELATLMAQRDALEAEAEARARALCAGATTKKSLSRQPKRSLSDASLCSFRGRRSRASSTLRARTARRRPASRRRSSTARCAPCGGATRSKRSRALTRPLSVSLARAQGFPRADIDVYNARQKRHRLACIQTDHKALMAQVEAALHRLHEASASNRTGALPPAPATTPTTPRVRRRALR